MLNIQFNLYMHFNFKSFYIEAILFDRHWIILNIYSIRYTFCFVVCSKSTTYLFLQDLCRELWCKNQTHALRAHPALEGTGCSEKPYPYGSVSILDMQIPLIPFFIYFFLLFVCT